MCDLLAEDATGFVISKVQSHACATMQGYSVIATSISQSHVSFVIQECRMGDALAEDATIVVIS